MKAKLQTITLWLKEAATNIWRFLLGILLLIIAMWLLPIVTIEGEEFERGDDLSKGDIATVKAMYNLN